VARNVAGPLRGERNYVIHTDEHSELEFIESVYALLRSEQVGERVWTCNCGIVQISWFQQYA